MGEQGLVLLGNLAEQDHRACPKCGAEDFGCECTYDPEALDAREIKFCETCGGAAPGGGCTYCNEHLYVK